MSCCTLPGTFRDSFWHLWGIVDPGFRRDDDLSGHSGLDPESSGAPLDAGLRRDDVDVLLLLRNRRPHCRKKQKGHRLNVPLSISWPGIKQ